MRSDEEIQKSISDGIREIVSYTLPKITEKRVNELIDSKLAGVTYEQFLPKTDSDNKTQN